MKRQLLSVRRWGVAALAGITILTAVAMIGEGAASAATPSVFGSGQDSTVPTSIGTNAAFTPSPVTLNITGVVAVGDTITLSLACPSSGTAAFTNAAPILAITGGDAVMKWTEAAATTNGACGSGVKNQLVFTDTVVPTTNISTSVNTLTIPAAGLGNLGMALNGVPTGNLTITGVYVNGTGSSSFTLPTLGAVANIVVTPASPLPVVAAGTGDASIGNLSVSLPAVDTVPVKTDYVCLTLTGPGAVTFDIIGGGPTVTETNGASNATVVSPAVIDAGGVQGAGMAFEELALSNESAPTFELTGVHVDVPTGTATGTETVEIGYATTAALCGTAPTLLLTGATAFAVGSAPSGPIYGTTADATTAAEFDTQFVTVTAGVAACTNGGNVVLATDMDPYDALSASYLEAQLGTGVLITPPSAPVDPNTLAALKYAGVQRVYVVGGTLAISQAVITALQATPAYTCGGLATTGSNLVVYSGISGTTADDTAVTIDNYITTTEGVSGIQGAFPALSSAYASESTYNQTTGNETTSAPVGAQKTAILVGDGTGGDTVSYTDAAAVAGIAYAYKLPIILTPTDALGSQAATELASLDITQVLVMGGPLAIANSVVTSIQAMSVNSTPVAVLRIAGTDATQTAADLAMFAGSVLGWSESTVFAATGAYWSDALGSAALQGLNKESLLLTEGPAATAGQYTDAALKLAGTPASGLGSGLTIGIQVLGGPLAVTSAEITEMQAALASG